MSEQSDSEWPTVAVILGVIAAVVVLLIWGPPEVAVIVGFLAFVFLLGVFG